MNRKILLAIPAGDLRRVDRAARRRGETRSAFIRRAAIAAAERPPDPGDGPGALRTLALILRRAEGRVGLTTREALAARDRGRR